MSYLNQLNKAEKSLGADKYIINGWIRYWMYVLVYSGLCLKNRLGKACEADVLVEPGR